MDYKVTYKILSSHNKAIRHTCISLIHLLATHVRDKYCTNYPLCSEVSTYIGTFVGL